MKIKEETRIVEVPTCGTDECGMPQMMGRLGAGMTQVEVAVVTLCPEEGRWLTQAGETDILQRVVTQGEVRLGRGDCAGNWREIEAGEAQALLESQRMAREAAEAALVEELGM